MGSQGKPVLIAGHTDSIGLPDYNRDLSRRRAATVKKWLTDKKIQNPALRRN
jgi:outer membrane protein OmpA-like peptidoglycan-associated protein